MRNTSYCTRSTLYVTDHTSYVIRNTSYCTRSTLYVTDHTSYGTRSTLYVTDHTSNVIRHTAHAIHQKITRDTSFVISRRNKFMGKRKPSQMLGLLVSGCYNSRQVVSSLLSRLDATIGFFLGCFFTTPVLLTFRLVGRSLTFT